jgi:hypothetical protein
MGSSSMILLDSLLEFDRLTIEAEVNPVLELRFEYLIKKGGPANVV